MPTLLLTICPSLPLRCNNQCVLEQAMCQWLTPVAELGVWPPNIIGQQTGEGETYCSVFFFCRGQREHAPTLPPLPAPLLVCTLPFPSSTSLHLKSLHLTYPVFPASSSPASCEDETEDLSPLFLKISVQSQADKDFNYQCSPAFKEYLLCFVSLT